MAFENLKDQIKEQLTDLWHRIQETPTYNNLHEKYETLPPASQRGIIAGAIAVITLFFISIPMTYLSSSSALVEEYENHRHLIRNLLRASRLANEAASLPPGVAAASIKAQIEGNLASTTLLPEQKAGVIDLDASGLGQRLAGATLKQDGIGVNLKNLNLNQVVEIGYSLQSLNPSVKMTGFDITPSQPDPHYFDVQYRLVVYSLADSTTDTNNEGATESDN